MFQEISNYSISSVTKLSLLDYIHQGIPLYKDHLKSYPKFTQYENMVVYDTFVSSCNPWHQINF